MQHYKQLLLEKLTNNGWELVEIDDDTDWWLDEIWTIKSTRQKWGHELKVLFLVNPLYEGHVANSPVQELVVVEQIPDNRPIGDIGIATISLHRGRFDIQLALFTNQLEDYRNNLYEK